MTNFDVSPLIDNSILYIYSERDTIQIDPDYQRLGDVWPLEKRQLLIDSIINGYDIPKFYFQRFSPYFEKEGIRYKYAIIDGRQRLETIWKFIENKFPLSSDFSYLADTDINLKGLTYSELAKDHQRIKNKFDAKSLSIFLITTDDYDLIEDMFSRLNEAVPLNAAEKRNALGGVIPPQIRQISLHNFFTSKLPFTNRRYRHYDLVTKFLYLVSASKIVDTKKIHLDRFVYDGRSMEPGDVVALVQRVSGVLDAMASVFVDNDYLLKSIGTVMVYFWLFYEAVRYDFVGNLRRNFFEKFDDERVKNRAIAENDMSSADFQLLEYDRLTQTPNDSYAFYFRYKVLIRSLAGMGLDIPTEIAEERFFL
jgi:hypothetical protein